MLLPDELWARVALCRFEEPAGERLDPGYRGARQRFAFVAAFWGAAGGADDDRRVLLP